MIAIICESFSMAKNDFWFFMTLLYQSEPWRVQRVWPNEYCVETDDDLRFIFIEKSMIPVFESLNADFIYSYDFFDDGNGYTFLIE